jgi:hypothetical protein
MRVQNQDKSIRRILWRSAILAILWTFLPVGCSAPPKLTAQQRRQDIDYLTQWATNYSPFVQLNEKHKGTPSYQAIKDRYVTLAEEARSNEDFFLVVCGYAGVIGASGHANLLSEDMLRWSAVGRLIGLTGG